MNISNVVEAISKTMEGVNLPANILPPMLLKCISLTRTGLSAYKIASKIIQNNKALGIPTETNPDGSENLINAFTYNVVKEVVEAIKNDATVQAAIPASSLLIEANGGNAGGPIVVTGTNLMDSVANGIIQ